MTRRKSHQPPAYRLHRASGQAIVTLSGKDCYLGPHGTDASKAEYDRLVAEWLANDRRPPAATPKEGGGITVSELILAYYRYAEAYYVKDGKQTGEQDYIRAAMRPLKRLYGRIPATEFGPLKLVAVREAMIAASRSRTGTNGCVNRIKRAFKWAVAQELIPDTVYRSLQAVEGLRRGRTEAHETAPIKPVVDEHVDAIKGHVSDQVWAMVELQRLTGMRSGEVVIMRSRDLDTTGKLWVYHPSSHKTEHHDYTRVVELGPQAQAIIRPFLKPDLDAYLFSPADAEKARHEEQRRNRKSPMTPSQSKRRRKRKPNRLTAKRYTVRSYRRAIKRGCTKADAPSWHPHQLRHSFATRIRKGYGLEAAKAVLGHSSIMATQIYAEVDRTVAARIAGEVG